MSESKLRAFADDAGRLVELPDLDGLARRGRDLRTRRRTSVVAGVEGLLTMKNAAAAAAANATGARTREKPRHSRTMNDSPASTGRCWRGSTSPRA